VLWITPQKYPGDGCAIRYNRLLAKRALKRNAIRALQLQWEIGGAFRSRPWQPTDAATGPKLTKTQTLAFDLLKRLIKNRGEKPPAELNLPDDLRVVRQAVWRDEFYKVHPAEKGATKQKAFVRVHADLYEAHLVQYLDEFACLWPDKPDKSDF
jgi:hypothetical protein